MSNWLKRCPKGHTSLRHQQNGGYACHTCGEVYDGDPYDVRETRFPVDESPRPQIGEFELLKRAVEFEQRGNSRWTWEDVTPPTVDDGRQVGRRLTQLRERGYIEVVRRRNTCYFWRVTQKAIDQTTDDTQASGQAVVAND